MKHTAYPVFAALWLVGTANAADITLPVMPAPPTVDGTVTPAEWRYAARFDRFQFKGTLQPRRAQAYIGATADAICVAIVSQIPDEGALKADIDRDSLKAVHDDSAEIYVNPNPDLPDNVEYQFLVNSLGKGGYNIHVLGDPDESAAWRGNWTHAHTVADGAWQMECIIPVSSMGTAGAGRRTTDGVWTVNATRNWKNPWEWSSLTGGYARSGIRFRFVAAPLPVPHFTFTASPETPPFDIALALNNPFDTPLAAAAELVLTRNNMPELRAEKDLELAPGLTDTLTLTVPENDPTTKYTLAAAARTADGRTTLFDRSVSWTRSDAPYRWIVDPEAKRLPMDMRFAYYPYRKRMRLLVDVRGMPGETDLSEVIADIRSAADGSVVTSVRYPIADFADGVAEKSFDLDLPEGHYRIVLRGKGTNIPEAEAIKPFERRIFPWEHLPVGRSTAVYPPFTPIDVAGACLRTVLREHDLNGLGLIDQVRAASANTGIQKAILAAPMRFEVRAGGTSLPVEPAALDVQSVEPHEARTAGGFTAGPLQASVATVWDVDGTARVALTLAADKPATLDALTLEIPFDPAETTLIHANSDRIRAPIAQAIPEGNGVVWDASAVACDDFIHNFCPYVYLGNAVRGLCWFAENDRHWGWDPETPNLDVLRRDNETVLRIHLINRPTEIEAPRTIVFGLLAAPVKPPLSPPERPQHWWRYRYLRDRYSLLGTDINWFSMGTCGSVYPAGKNLYFWEMLARSNREKLEPETVRQVIETGLRYFEPYGEKKVQAYTRHVHHNLRARYQNNMVFYYNRASHQACEEFETFKDEWCLTDFRSVPKGNGLGEIKVVPSESFIDYNLYWYARSFEIGANRGVYWDNFFIAPSFNTEMTDAYRREDGSIVPAAGIWGLRDLAKRTFIMMNERGMLPIAFAHMTSFSPLPMLSYCTVQYDWEWKYSQGDVQDRHSREYLLLASTGELAGVWPVPLADHGKLADDLWTQRTFTAVRILHELDGYGGCGQGWLEAHTKNRALLDPILALLDDDRLVVFKYWEDRPQPVTADHSDVFTIVYSIPGVEAVAAVVSYAREEVQTPVRIDAPALGFAPAALTVADAETQAPVSVSDGTVPLALKGHGIRVFRITGGAAQ